MESLTEPAGGFTIDTPKRGETNHTHIRPNTFLATGAVCYLAALVLHVLQDTITSHKSFNFLACALQSIADALWSTPAAAVAVLIIALIFWLYYDSRRESGRMRSAAWVRRLPAFLKLLLLALLFIYTLFPLNWAQRGFTRSLESFPAFTVTDFFVTLLCLGGTILCFCYCLERLPLRIIDCVEKTTSRFFALKESLFIISALALTLAATAIIADVVLDRIPHVEDSIAQLFQAKIFRTGRLWAPLPPHKEFFDYINVINDEKWYSQYAPGHPLLLTLGLFAGVPWLIGPILGTLSLLLFFLLIKKAYGDRQMLYLSCALMLLSPFFLFMSSNHMNHSSTTFCILAFVLAYLRMFSSRSPLPGIIAGLALGYVLNIRPLDAVAIGIPFAGHLLYCTHRSREVPIRNEGCFLSAFLLMAGMLLLYNYLTNGDPLLFGYQKHYHTLGFLGNAQLGPPHTLKGGIVNTSNNLIALNQYLFEWPLPSLVFIFIFFALPVKKSRWEYLFLAACLSIIGGYFFYWYQDLCYGPRFYYSLLPFMIIFTARGFLALPHWLSGRGFDPRRAVACLYLPLFVFFLYTLSVSLPLLVKKYSSDYWWVTDKIHRTVAAQGITNAIVFIDVWHPPGVTEPNRIPYGSGFQFNSPDLKDDVIYAMDLREKNGELMKAFPERNYYLCKIHKPMSDFTLLKIEKNSIPSDGTP